jgi:hypothetical protein
MTSPVAISIHDVSPAFTDIFLPAPIIPASTETFFVPLFVIYSFRRRCSIGTSPVQTALVAERQDYIFFRQILDALSLFLVYPEKKEGDSRQETQNLWSSWIVLGYLNRAF